MHIKLPPIGLCGPIGCGKTTAAKFLEGEFDFHRIRFAGPLKDMMQSLGLSDDEIDGGLKEQPCHLLGGKTPRYAMQMLGTEWGRMLIDSELWVRAWRLRALATHYTVVADDVRFENEAQAIRDMGGVVIQIYRPGVTSGGHASELQGIKGDFTIINGGDIAELEEKLGGIITGVEEHAVA